MRLAIQNDYPTDWSHIAYVTKLAAEWRCVRCHHPFEPETGAVMRCDDRCDPKRGIHRKAAPRTYGALQPFDERLAGLNYGVHHFDGDKSNCRWWNLMALCNSCHLTIQALVIPERQWIFDHSAWAQPYVGGFYAYWFAGRDETRERVVALQRFFLAVGQPWLHPDLAGAVRDYIAGSDGAAGYVQRTLADRDEPNGY